jgi:hypothetical protein
MDPNIFTPGLSKMIDKKVKSLSSTERDKVINEIQSLSPRQQEELIGTIGISRLNTLRDQIRSSKRQGKLDSAAKEKYKEELKSIWKTSFEPVKEKGDNWQKSRAFWGEVQEELYEKPKTTRKQSTRKQTNKSKTTGTRKRKCTDDEFLNPLTGLCAKYSGKVPGTLLKMYKYAKTGELPNISSESMDRFFELVTRYADKEDEIISFFEEGAGKRILNKPKKTRTPRKSTAPGKPSSKGRKPCTKDEFRNYTGRCMTYLGADAKLMARVYRYETERELPPGHKKYVDNFVNKTIPFLRQKKAKGATEYMATEMTNFMKQNPKILEKVETIKDKETTICPIYIKNKLTGKCVLYGPKVKRDIKKLGDRATNKYEIQVSKSDN